MQVKKTIILLILFLFGYTAFSQEIDKNKLFEQSGYKFPYLLTEPNNSWKLPDKLVEVSGLTYYDKNELALVQDEKGNIYFFDITTGKVTDKIDFSDKGDYEGIELVNDHIWVLESNGNLFRIKYSKKDKSYKTKDYKTDLSKKNDTEGLAFDRIGNRLLIACKGHPYIDDEKGKNKRAVYSFDLEEEKLSKKPVIKFDLKQIKELKKLNTMAKLGVDLLTFINPSKGDVSFQPSGIAIHPQTGNIYLLASVGKLLIVCNDEGDFLAVIKLKSSLFNQPEGICFDPDGNLYISNEGDDFAATILKFHPN
ncbi:MAG: SdiA-regulated domain-containing protein [Mariniphaga sp.]|nr:SdiA-regulated domain-containing protein [Mariniphaga sp.]